MNIHAKVGPADAAPRIGESDEQPYEPAIAREAQGQGLARAIGRQRQERCIVRIATDHPVQGDYVGRLKGSGGRPEITEHELDAARVPDAGGLPAGDIARKICRDLEVPEP
ncbi:MAG: hypothetical protein ACHQXA_01840 [Gemmatimonadales bacterium]